MASPTWNERELKILEAIAEAADRGANPGNQEIVRLTGLPKASVDLGLRRLFQATYVTGSEVTNQGERFELVNIELLERALRELRIWPDVAADVLLAALEVRIEAEADPVAKSKLVALRDAAVGVGRDVLTSVVSQALTQVVTSGRLPGA